MDTTFMDATPTSTTTMQGPEGWGFKLCKTIINTITTNPDDACYVTGICANATHIATSSSNNIIKLYNISDFTLAGELTGHTTTINKLFFKKKRPHELVSCSMDKTICVWDTNKKTHIKYWASPKEVLTIAMNEEETILAGACDTDIFVWSLENYSLIRTIRDQHSMEITWMQFHPNFPNYIFSGSEDGLIMVTDITITSDEDYSIQTFNFEQSILNFHFYGQSNEALASISQVGTFAIWDLVNEELVHNFGNLREILTKDTIAVDYLIKCFYSKVTNKLFLVAGSYSGDLFIYRVEGKELKFLQHLTNAHSDIVRDILWFEEAGTLLTVGEDSRLCVWRNDPNASPVQNLSPPGEKASRKQKTKKINKAAPY
jgi:WD40 repeat protein